MIRKKDIIFWGLFIASLLSALYLYRFLVKKTEEGIRIIEKAVVNNLAKERGIQLEYSLRPTAFLAKLQLTDVSVRFPDGSKVAFDKIEARYDLLDILLNGKQSFSNFTFIKGLYLYDGGITIASLEGTGGGLPPPFDIEETAYRYMDFISFPIRGYDFHLTVDSQSPVDIEKFFFRVGKSSEDTLYFNSRFTASLNSEKGLLAGGEAMLRGRLNKRDLALSTDVKLRNIRSESLELKDQRFSILFKDRFFEVRNLTGVEKFDIQLFFDLERQDVAFSFHSREFRPEDVIKSNENTTIRQLLEGKSFKGEASLLYASGTKQFSYQADGSVTLEKTGAVVDIQCVGDLETIVFSSLQANTSYGQIDFVGDVGFSDLLPEGRISFKNAPSVGRTRTSAAFNLDRDRGKVIIDSEYVFFDSTPLPFIRGVVALEDKEYRFSFLVPDEEGRDGTGVINGSFSPFGNSRELISEFRLNSFAGSTLGKIAGISPSPQNQRFLANHDLTLEGDLRFTDEMTLNIRNLLFKETLNPENFFALEFAYADKNIMGESFTLNYKGLALDGSFLGGGTPENFTGEIYLKVMGYSISFALERKENTFVIEGSNGIYGEYFMGKESDTFLFECEDLPLPYFGQLFFVSINIGAVKNDQWRGIIPMVKVAFPSFLNAKNPYIECKGNFDPLGVELETFVYSDSVSKFEGNAALFLPKEGEQGRFLVNLDSENYENINANGLFSGNGVFVETAGNISPERFQKELLGGSLAFDITTNFSDRPEYLEADLSVDNALFRNRAFSAASRLLYEDMRFTANNVNFQWGNFLFSRGLLRFDGNDGLVTFGGGIETGLNGSTVAGGFVVKLTTDTINDFSELQSLQSRNYSGNLRFTPLLWNEESVFPSLSANIMKDDGGLSIIGDVPDSLEILLSPQGNAFYFLLGNPFPVTFTANGVLMGQMVDVKIDDIDIDPFWLNYLMPLDPVIKRPVALYRSGSITGRMHLEGSFLDPEIDGELDVESLLLESPYINGKLSPVTTRIVARGRVVMMEPMTISIGNGSISIPGYEESYIRFENLIPRRYFLKINIPRSERIPGVYNCYGLDIKTQISGEYTISGDEKEGSLEGETLLDFLTVNRSAEYNKWEPKESRGTYGTLYPFSVNLTTRIGNNGLIAFPNESLPIIRGRTTPGGTLIVNYVGGDIHSSTIMGEIRISSGELFFVGKNIDIESGRLVFNEYLPEFAPRLLINASVTTIEENDNPVTIGIRYEGDITRFSSEEFSPTLSSEPPRSEEELQRLVAQGIIPFSTNETDSLVYLPAIASGWGERTTLVPIENFIRKTMNLDFVSIETNILSNLLIEQYSSSGFDEVYTGRSTEDETSLRYLDGSRLAFSKYITENDDILFELNLQFDYDTTEKTFIDYRGLQIVPGISFDFNTPFFTVRWGMGFSKVDELFIPDNTMTLLWEHSYR